MSKSKMLYRYLGQFLVHLPGGWRHFLSMTVRLIIFVSIFILALPISVRADNIALTPNDSSYDTSDNPYDHTPILRPAVKADDTDYDAYQVPATKDELMYQAFHFDFPSTITDTINSFELLFIYNGSKQL